ncbi:HNH endonuclease signature motif containing protein [Microbacterium sp. VKM Ac-2870]|uniref:HNH endonuclease signature motif containing protein n=1 Tax=Microbacterium sp. VKM Ac-2870 TaxID=2783825 RepID=UPI001E5EAAC7|nr:HNH endonuclease signature motif containing protein [Microbacterium sp. VKM Ac-2870]
MRVSANVDEVHDVGRVVDTPWLALDILVSDVVAARRRIAEAQAEEARLLAGAVGLIADRTEVLRQEAQQQGRPSGRSNDADLPLREVALELGMAMRASDRGVQRRMSEAYLLTTVFPRTHAAWASGEIDAGHVWAIARAGALLRTDEDRARFETLALEAARTESPTRMNQAAKAIAATIDPTAFEDAARRAVDERSVRLFDLDDGMARLIADLPAPIANAIYDSLTTRARAIVDRTGPDADADADADDSKGMCGEPRRADGVVVTGRTAGAEHRTLAQVRADVFGDLLLTAAPSTTATGAGVDAISARIQVTVPASTLAGDPAGGPAILAGYGPIDPAVARRLAGLAPGWDRVFTDPHTGIPVAVDRYRPSAELSRYLAARDERCRTPGCTRTAHRCDRDHTTAAADGGATAHGNLAHLCRRHHTVKHHTAWRVRHLGGGTLEWTGPTGRRYTDRPPSLVRFVPAAEDPPPF